MTTPTSTKQASQTRRISTAHLPAALQEICKTRHDHYQLTRVAIKSPPPVNTLVKWIPMLNVLCITGTLVVVYFGGWDRAVEVVYLVALTLILQQWHNTQAMYLHNWNVFRTIVKAELGLLVEEIETLENQRDDQVQGREGSPGALGERREAHAEQAIK